MSPELFCYVNFSTDFIEFPLGRGCYTKSVSSESCLKMVLENLVPQFFFNLAFLYQNEQFDNLRNRKFEVNKIQRKRVAGEKDGKCDNWILHVSY